MQIEQPTIYALIETITVTYGYTVEISHGKKQWIAALPHFTVTGDKKTGLREVLADVIKEIEHPTDGTPCKKAKPKKSPKKCGNSAESRKTNGSSKKSRKAA